MTLPLDGPFSAGDVNVELKRPRGQMGTPDDLQVRQLAKKPSGMYSASDLRGRSAEVVIELSTSDHNFNTSTLHQLMLNAIGGDWGKKGNTFRVRVKSGVQLVSANTANACFWFGGGVVGNTVVIENHGYILGRGGIGGIIPSPGGQNAGSPGGAAIISDGGVTLVIDNAGVIAGGGGGGGATGWYDGGSGNYTSTGGGGAPFGAAGSTNNGSNNRWWGIAASFDAGGAGGSGDGRPAGRGGAWGQVGGNGIYKPNGGSPSPTVSGGSAGAAINVINGSTCSYVNRGDIRGYSP